MALTDNSIGPFPFISLQGQLQPPREMTSIDDRPGVDGTEITLLGNKGEPFTMISRVDAENLSNGEMYHSVYKTIIGTAVELVRGGVSTEANGYLVMVLAVRRLDVFPISGAVGNTIHPPSEAMVITEWDLISVPLPE